MTPAPDRGGRRPPVILALMVLSTFKINLAPLLASAGVAGVAIGFGARNLVTDFLDEISDPGRATQG